MLDCRAANRVVGSSKDSFALVAIDSLHQCGGVLQELPLSSPAYFPTEMTMDRQNNPNAFRETSTCSTADPQIEWLVRPKTALSWLLLILYFTAVVFYRSSL
jgi:hypothetical protein